MIALINAAPMDVKSYLALRIQGVYCVMREKYTGSTEVRRSNSTALIRIANAIPARDSRVKKT